MPRTLSYAAQRDEMQARMAGQATAELVRGFATAAQRLDELDFAARAPKRADPAQVLVVLGTLR